LPIIKDAEKTLDVLVYHVHRLEGVFSEVMYAFLVVSRRKEEWEMARKMAAEGLPDCVAPVLGYGDFEYSSLPVEQVWGCLMRTN
jgi:hypothetical protein